MDSNINEIAPASAYQQLRQRILNRELKPGEPLRQRRMAKELGVGITPLREALVRLECEGLIETVPQWGSRVRLFSEQSIRQYYELREAIECQTARLCAQRATTAELTELALLAAQVDDFYDQAGDLAAGCRADAQFHGLIARSARSEMLLDQFNRLQLLAELALIEQTLGQAGQIRTGTHIRLAKAIKTGDPEKADVEMRKHLDPAINTARLVSHRTLQERH